MTAPFAAPPFMFDNTSQLYTDQHGRTWESAVTPLSRQPGERGPMFDRTGYLTPVDFTLVWMLPHEYIRTVHGARGQNLIEHEYDRFIADTRQAYAEWENEIRKTMQRAFGKEYHPGLAPTPGVLADVGPAPRAWQPADAARKGNRWILFGEGTMPSKLAPFFPVADPTVDADTLTWEDEEPARGNAAAVLDEAEEEAEREAAMIAKRAARQKAQRPHATPSDEEA